MQRNSSKSVSYSPDHGGTELTLNQIRRKITALPKIYKTFQSFEEIALKEFQEEIEQRKADGNPFTPIEIARHLLDNFENLPIEQLASLGKVDIDFLKQLSLKLPKTK